MMVNEKGQLVGETAKAAASKAKEGILAFGNSVATKSKEVMEIAKLNAKKSRKESEIEDYYRKLGELAYIAGGLSGELGEIAQSIKQNYEDLQQIELDINTAQNIKICRECGNKCAIDDGFCAHCGTKL
ncbi:MAG: hypothetical protein RSA86_05810 [Christensenellaceae bacterium]